MRRSLVRPAFVPTAIAVWMPLLLVQWSLLAAGLSLFASVALVFLGMQLTRQARLYTVLRAGAIAFFAPDAPEGVSDGLGGNGFGDVS